MKKTRRRPRPPRARRRAPRRLPLGPSRLRRHGPRRDDAKRIVRMIEVLNAEFPTRGACSITRALRASCRHHSRRQCTDAMVNQVTKSLFRKYPARIVPRRPAGRAREGHLQDGLSIETRRRVSRAAVRRSSKSTRARCPPPWRSSPFSAAWAKDANCVLGVSFGIPGIVVDTHVRRLAYRMGYTVETTR